MRRDILQQFGGSCVDEILAILVDNERQNLYIKFSSLCLLLNLGTFASNINIADITHSSANERENANKEMSSHAFQIWTYEYVLVMYLKRFIQS